MVEQTYQDVLSAFEKRLGEMTIQDLQGMAEGLSRRGVFTSPYGTRPEVDIRQKYAQIGAEKTAEMNLGEYLRKIKRSEKVADIQQQRGWQLEDIARQEEWYKTIAEMYKPREKQWWETGLEAGLTGLGMGLGSSLNPLGFLSPAKGAPSPTGKLSLYGGTPGSGDWWKR